jgi:hypothetical protein
VVTLGFNKKNLRNHLALSAQKPWGQPNKIMPKKKKGTKHELNGFTSYSMEQNKKRCVEDVLSLIRRIALIHHKP